MENQLLVLPEEVKELAVKVSANKKEEVGIVLNQVFMGTANWESQVDAIEVKSINDTLSMELADVARKNVKKARLSAEKIFDMKRDEVKQLKSEYDLEDKLWLKAKQIMELKFKAIEEKAAWKAEFLKRHIADLKEKKIQERIALISMYDIPRIEFENMSDDSFAVFLDTIKKDYEKKQLEKQEAERAQAEENERAAKIIEEQRKENEKLRKELEDKKKLEDEQKAAEEKRLEEERKANQKLSKAPIKKQLTVWVDSFTAPELSIDNEKTKLILSKFEGFKQWAKKEIEGM